MVDAVKRSKLTKRGENILGVAFVVVLAYALITSWTGYLGGMLNQDFVWMAVAAIILIGRDPVTTTINKGLNKFPLSKYMADFSAGLYLTHIQLLQFTEDWLNMTGSRTGAALIFMGVCCLCAVGFVVIMRLVLKPLYGCLGNALKLNTPVGKAFEEQVPAAR